MKKCCLYLVILFIIITPFPLTVYADGSASAALLSSMLLGSTVSGNVVTLNNSVALSSTPNFSMSNEDSVILDLNGFTITGCSSGAGITASGGRLIIRDSAGGGKIQGGAGSKGANGVLSTRYAQQGSVGCSAISISDGVLILASGTIQGGVGGEGGDGATAAGQIVLGSLQSYFVPASGGVGGNAISANNSSILISDSVVITGGDGGNGGVVSDILSFNKKPIKGGDGGNGGFGINAQTNSVVISIDENMPLGGQGGEDDQEAWASPGNVGDAVNADENSKILSLTTRLLHLAGVSYSGWETALSKAGQLALIVTPTGSVGAVNIIVKKGNQPTTDYSYDNSTGLFSINMTDNTEITLGQNSIPALREGIAFAKMQSVTVGVPFRLDLSTIFTDADGDALTYFCDGSPITGSIYSYIADDESSATRLFQAKDQYATSEDTYSVMFTALYAKSIVSIDLFRTDGLVDVYKISYTDGTYDLINITNGADGINGADGADGINGADGADGINGADGADGINGADGANGADGKSGVKDISIDNNRHLIVTYMNGSSVDIGALDRKNGVIGAKIEDDGRLILTMSDGNAVEVGQVWQTAERDKSGLNVISIVIAIASLIGNCVLLVLFLKIKKVR